MDYFVYLKDRITEIDGETEGDLSASSLPKWPKYLELDQAETKSLKLHLCLPYRWQSPKYVGHFSLPFQMH